MNTHLFKYVSYHSNRLDKVISDEVYVSLIIHLTVVRAVLNILFQMFKAVLFLTLSVFYCENVSI